MAPEDPNPAHPLYNTTFSLLRVSPLYTGRHGPLSNATLRKHAQRFRDILVGEVLRGVRVGLGTKEDDVLSRVGALQTVTWRQLPEEQAWSAADETGSAHDDVATGLALLCRGMIVTVAYEKIEYRAILLRDGRGDDADASSMGTGGKETDDGFQSFPLLMTKMPGSLREAFTEFLASTFDTRVSALCLSSQYLVSAFERYLADISMGEDGEPLGLIERSRALRHTIKETLVVIGFDIPGGSAALKTIDINIAREDLPRMVARGKTIGRQGDGDSPFFEALTTYIKGHMALDLRNEKVKISRIACGAFVLGSEGKIKLTQLPSESDGQSSRGPATRRLINGLIGAAAGVLLSGG
ncbi:uncharacterized protein L3040_002203 [Drepanopeziza brunnea f. sp. 'multigermtubi']|uniref:Siroheme synthase n=1 Tax=Marssonina brunnea f. sp. multigermtubi (strain MB_m1) TaxID=1072389 RepID=K1Y4R2_MARBU|nr:siroheme synthase [Drepanopeziza brunnea f. sp. 'multigermtubi' MB_m1]EKD20124.1 siroheme synthase [Drepanopeziza brunnea f. sp. 'multigermtubi' MB_m1]KAJ5050320.1 hypothetical protein L3040_002203 [Drepanopeziza brunnea f. sp. 'multigermtubi']